MFDPRQRLKLYLRARRIRRRGDPEIARLADLVGGRRRAVDVGANRGVYSYWLARCCARVEAFEPNPELARRLDSAGLGNVAVHRVALSDRGGTAELLVPRHRKGGLDDPGGRLAGLDPLDAAARFPTTLARLDDFSLADVDFIKIDVEGHEERVLDGAWGVIARDRPALLIELEERHNSGCLARVRERFAAIGYRMLFLDGGQWRDAGALGPGQAGPSGRYINNFLMIDAARAAALAKA